MSSKPFAITLDVGTSLANRTGSWRTLRPVYVNRLPPCNAKCPCRQSSARPGFITQRAEIIAMLGTRLSRIIRSLLVWGRVCYHTCESACNRGELDESVGINAR